MVWWQDELHHPIAKPVEWWSHTRDHTGEISSPYLIPLSILSLDLETNPRLSWYLTCLLPWICLGISWSLMSWPSASPYIRNLDPPPSLLDEFNTALDFLRVNPVYLDILACLLPWIRLGLSSCLDSSLLWFVFFPVSRSFSVLASSSSGSVEYEARHCIKHSIWYVRSRRRGVSVRAGTKKRLVPAFGPASLISTEKCRWWHRDPEGQDPVISSLSLARRNPLRPPMFYKNLHCTSIVADVSNRRLDRGGWGRQTSTCCGNLACELLWRSFLTTAARHPG